MKQWINKSFFWKSLIGLNNNFYSKWIMFSTKKLLVFSSSFLSRKFSSSFSWSSLSEKKMSWKATKNWSLSNHGALFRQFVQSKKITLSFCRDNNSLTDMRNNSQIKIRRLCLHSIRTQGICEIFFVRQKNDLHRIVQIGSSVNVCPDVQQMHSEDGKSGSPFEWVPWMVPWIFGLNYYLDLVGHEVVEKY